MEAFTANILVNVTSVDTMEVEFRGIKGNSFLDSVEWFSQTSACLMFTLGSRDIMTNKERKKIRMINKRDV